MSHTITVLGPPPPTVAPAPPLWVQLPQPNRARLLWLLSQMLERHVVGEAAHEPDTHAPGADHGGI